VAARIGEDQRTGHQRSKAAAERVQRLRQRKANRRAVLRPKNGNIRIRRSLERGNPRSHHEYRSQKQRKTDQLGRRHKQQAAHNLNEQRNHHRVLITDDFDQLRRGRRENKVGQKKRRLGQHRQTIRQIEDRPQMRHERHVQVGDKPKDKEQCGDGNKRNQVAMRCERGRRFGVCCHVK
jgi:hypothetical protein